MGNSLDPTPGASTMRFSPLFRARTIVFLRSLIFRVSLDKKYRENYDSHKKCYQVGDTLLS